jgi:hypothetical protein
MGVRGGPVAPVVLAVALAAAAAPATAAPATADPAHDGAIALLDGRLDEAEVLYGRALAEHDPGRDQADIWFDLCLTRYAAGAFGDAINACYRALADPQLEPRVQALLAQIRDAIVHAGLDTADLVLPEPTADWAAPRLAITFALRGEAPSAFAVATRFVDDPDRPSSQTSELVPDALPPDHADALRGPPPPLPYRVPGMPRDYTRGDDVDLKVAYFYYAHDASPFVVGAKYAHRWRTHGSAWRSQIYAEYLGAPDGTGGVGAIGFGEAGEFGLSLEEGLAVPWGKDDRRVHATIPGYAVSFDFQSRLTYRAELAIGGADKLSLELGLAGGINLAQFFVGFGKVLTGDVCTDDDCPETFWPLMHGMVTVAIGFGRRAGGPAYDRPEVFAPLGAPP